MIRYFLFIIIVVWCCVSTGFSQNSEIIESSINWTLRNDTSSANRILLDTLFNLKKYDSVKKFLSRIESENDRNGLYALYAKKALEHEQHDMAVLFADAVVKNFRKDPENFYLTDLRDLVFVLAYSGRFDDVDLIAESYEDERGDSDKWYRVFLPAVRGSMDGGHSAAVVRYLTLADTAVDRDDLQMLMALSNLYKTTGNTEKARDVLNEVIAYLENEGDEGFRKFHHLKAAYDLALIGDRQNAVKLLTNNLDENDPENISEAVRVYSALKDMGSVKKLLAKPAIVTGNHISKTTVFDSLLLLGNMDMAEDFARQMSDSPDSYEQQTAFDKLIRHHIKDGKNDKASAILSLSYNRAKMVKWEHDGYQSIGASPGTRKVQYLRMIFENAVRLKNYGLAFDSISAVDSEDNHAVEFMARQYAKFAETTSPKLFKKKIDAFYTKANRLMADEDSLYLIKLSEARLNAASGNREESVNLLAEALEIAFEGCCSIEDALIGSIHIFEKYGLESNDRLQQILKQISKSDDD